jgi:cell division septation protein DedD
MLFGVQVAAFGNERNARALVEELKEQGFTDAWTVRVGRISRVFTGKYYFQDEAEVLKQKVREAGYGGASVRRVQ